MAELLAPVDRSLQRVAVAAMHMALTGDPIAAAPATPGTASVFSLTAVAGPPAAVRVRSTPSVPGLVESAGPEVKGFVQAKSLNDVVGDTVRLIYDHFPPWSIVSLRMQNTPEWTDGDLVVDISVHSTVAEALKNYSAFIGDWTRTIPPAAQGLISITFCAV